MNINTKPQVKRLHKRWADPSAELSFSVIFQDYYGIFTFCCSIFPVSLYAGPSS